MVQFPGSQCTVVYNFSKKVSIMKLSTVHFEGLKKHDILVTPEL